MNGEKAKLENALDSALKRVELVEKRNFQLNKKLNSTLQAIRQKGEQTDLLKNYLQEFKLKSHIYSPDENDIIDLKLAEYLNSLSDPHGFSALFSRENEGIYHFGTKRVFVKIENSKIISIFEYCKPKSTGGRWILAFRGIFGNVWSSRAGKNGKIGKKWAKITTEKSGEFD